MTNKLLNVVKALAIVFVLFSIWNFYESCNVKKKLKKYEAIIVTHEETIVVIDTELKQAELEHAVEIAELNGMIDSSNTVIAGLEQDMGAQEQESQKKIGELEAEHSKLPTLQAKYDNAMSQIVAWKERFNLVVTNYKSQLGQKDKVIFSLKEKYTAEYNLRVETENSLADYKSLYLELADEVVPALMKDLERAGGTFWTKLAYSSIGGALGFALGSL